MYSLYKGEAGSAYVGLRVTAARLHWRSLGGVDIGIDGMIEKQAADEELREERGLALVQVKAKSESKVNPKKTLIINASRRNRFYWQHQKLPVILAIVTTDDLFDGLYCKSCYWINFNALPAELIRPSKRSCSIRWQKLGTRWNEFVYWTGDPSSADNTYTKFKRWVETVLVLPSEILTDIRLNQADQFIRDCRPIDAAKALSLSDYDEKVISWPFFEKLKLRTLKIGRLRMCRQGELETGPIKEIQDEQNRLKQKGVELRNVTKTRRIIDYELGYLNLLQAYKSPYKKKFWTLAERYFTNSVKSFVHEDAAELEDYCTATDLLLKTRAHSVLVRGIQAADIRFLKSNITRAKNFVQELENSKYDAKTIFQRTINLVMSMCRAHLALTDLNAAREDLVRLDTMCRPKKKPYVAFTVTIQIPHLKGFLALVEGNKERSQTFLNAAQDAIYMTADDPEWGLIQNLLMKRVAEVAR
jgi:hypothetical protein